jgi:class 3 adenylate cyclase
MAVVVTPPRILVVDATGENIRLLDPVLTPSGYAIDFARSGTEALERLATSPPDLVLLDAVAPESDGHELCVRIRAMPALELLPVVMITPDSGAERVKALEAGADDFVVKPFDRAELLARVRSLLRIKRYHDTIQRQAVELADWNRELEHRVREQVAQIERLARLKRFLPAQLAELVAESGDESFLESHRCDITVLFCDLRGFTRFAETSEPEATMNVLNEYFTALGALVERFEGTLERFTGDGLIVIFNDPAPCPDAAIRSVRLGVAMRSSVADLIAIWRRSGYDLGFAVGIAQGYATLGRVGFEGRLEYTAIGTVMNLAARLCGVAEDGQVLVGPGVHAAVEACVVSAPVTELRLKGFARAVTAYNILEIDPARVPA